MAWSKEKVKESSQKEREKVSHKLQERDKETGTIIGAHGLHGHPGSRKETPKEKEKVLRVKEKVRDS